MDNAASKNLFRIRPDMYMHCSSTYYYYTFVVGEWVKVEQCVCTASWPCFKSVAPKATSLNKNAIAGAANFEVKSNLKGPSLSAKGGK